MDSFPSRCTEPHARPCRLPVRALHRTICSIVTRARCRYLENVVDILCIYWSHAGCMQSVDP
eukprot:24056-Eustigmatos_ZCMA.PRE.1